MLNPASPLARLMTAPMRPGLVRAILLRPARRAEPLTADRATLDPLQGMVGDRYDGRSGNRQVTLIQTEDIAAIAAHLGLDAIDPVLLRRNIVVSGINLSALKDRHLRIGDAVLAVTGECHPCSRMEEVLGPGGYNAVRGRGGVTARVLTGGVVAVGDAVSRVDAASGEVAPAPGRER